MPTREMKIRPLHRNDLRDLIEIDGLLSGGARPDYYEAKFARALDEKNRVVISMVAEIEGKVAAFVMCELFTGEYGIPSSTATLDTLGVHPDHQGSGAGRQLMGEFLSHLRKAGVEKVNTLVAWNDWRLIRFFSASGFKPAETINLELGL